MIGYKTAKIRTPAGLLYLTCLSVLLSTGCQPFHYESRLMKSAQAAEQTRFKMTAGELRLQLDDLVGVFSGTIEQAADRVIAESANEGIKRHALMWKINAIPAAYRSLFQADPAVALIDTWVYSMQMVAYFEHGPGKDDFGQWQPVALDASRKLETTFTGLAKKTRTDSNITPLQEKI
jgi:hypothetical protein